MNLAHFVLDGVDEGGRSARALEADFVGRRRHADVVVAIITVWGLSAHKHTKHNTNGQLLFSSLLFSSLLFSSSIAEGRKEGNTCAPKARQDGLLLSSRTVCINTPLSHQHSSRLSYEARCTPYPQPFRLVYTYHCAAHQHSMADYLKTQSTTQQRPAINKHANTAHARKCACLR